MGKLINEKKVTLISAIIIIFAGSVIMLALIFGGGNMAQNSIVYKGNVKHTYQEIERMFCDNEEKFDYIVDFILNKTYGDFYLGIATDGTYRPLFYKLVSYEGNSYYIEEEIDNKIVGYTKNEKFEQYLKEILIDNKLITVECITNSVEKRVYFDSFRVIQYLNGFPNDVTKQLFFDNEEDYKSETN